MTEREETENLSTADLIGRADEPRDDNTATGQTDRLVESQPETTPLFEARETEQFRSRWDEIQTGFVDEPRRAVEQADTLVAEVMQQLATVFADERQKLEQQWSQGDDVSTEDLRQALRRYRSFFDRLLSV